jgi:hypothetical protein
VNALLPVVIPLKGELLDNFELRDASGAMLSALSYQEYLQLVASILRTLLTGACGGKIDDEVRSAERLAFSDILDRGPATPVPRMAGARALRRLDDGTGTVNKELLDLAARLVEQLSERYAIVASLPVGQDGRLAFQYSQTVTPTLSLLGGRGLMPWLKSRLRILVGARPVSVSLPLDGAWTSQSYHLRVNSEEGLYLASQEAPKLDEYLLGYARVMSEWPTFSQASAPPHYRFRSRLGQSYAHFYCRFFPEPQWVDPSDLGVSRGGDSARPIRPIRGRVPNITFRFFEAPPGSVFRAAAAACACALLIWGVGVVSSVGDPKTDAPTVLLAVPAAAAAWLGFDSPKHRLLEGTLAARLSFGATFLLSIMASCLFMADRSGLRLVFSPDMSGFPILGIHDFAWASLTIASFLNLGIILFAYAVRSWEYLYLSKRENRYTDIRQPH